MTIPIYQVDAFTDRAFAGNPAAVCVLDAPMPDEWMQHLAAEMNLSETAFLSRREGRWPLRWFTPTTEVELCGHATLASAHVLWETQRLGPDEPARFETRSGRLTARRAGDWIEMDFPATWPEPADAPPGLIESLGVEPVCVCRCGWTWLVEVADANVVRGVRPDFAALGASPAGGAIVTSRSDLPACDFISRCFAPVVGVDEDPVTGAAHCCLGPFWAERLGKEELVARQVSKRGGVVKVRVAGERVHLAGQAVTVFRGELPESALATGRDPSTIGSD